MLITLHSGTVGLTGLRRLRETVKLSARALLHRHAVDGWLQLLNSSPLFTELVADHPRLVYKIFRPYNSNTMDYHGRLAMLTQHYRFIQRQGLAPLTARGSRGRVLLTEVIGKSGLPYQVVFNAVEPMEREGEMVLQLVQGDDLIYSSAFTFCQGEQGMMLAVGCMQGPRGEHGLQLIKDATRELHGLRPKSMMVKLLGQVGHAFGCSELRLVSNANRTVCRSVKQGKVHADYDTLWQEMDATVRADGDYRLPCTPLAEPDLAAIASKKRSEARKRHDTLAALVDGVVAALKAPQQASQQTPAQASTGNGNGKHGGTPAPHGAAPVHHEQDDYALA